MFWALTTDLVDTRGHDFEQVLADIQTLNQWARAGRLEVTAISLAAYPFVQEDYALLPHGASIGSGYGPVVVARQPLSATSSPTSRSSCPGTLTTSYLTLRLVLGTSRTGSCRSTRSPTRSRRVARRRGLLIHEGQLTFEDYGLVKVLDLGEWWLLETGLPLPLGVNVVRRDLGEEVLRDVSNVLREAIDCGLDNRAEALEYALQFGRGIDAAVADRFVSMYVNDLTQDYGDEGRKAVTELLRRGEALGAFPRPSTSTSSREIARRACALRASSSRPCGRRSAATAGRSRAFGPDDLAAVAIAAAVERSGVDPAAIDDVYLGCANQAGEDNRNVARMAALLAGFPDSVPGVTLNRLCASGLSAVVSACHAVLAGRRGGRRRRRRRVDEPRAARHGEAGRRVPAREPDRLGHDARLALPEPAPRGDVPARVDGRDGRERRRAVGGLARGPGRVRAPLAGSAGPRRTRPAASRTSSSRRGRDGRRAPAPETTAEALAGLKPAFRADGTVTAGNASGINDGAAGARDRERGARARAGRRAARGVRRLRGRRSRPPRDGHRPDPGGAQAARARGSRPLPSSTSSS